MSFETTPFKTLFKVPQKNGLNKPSRVRGEGLPMVNMGEIFAYRRIADIEMDLVPTTEKEMGALLEYGDLLFARQSLVYEGSGKCAIFVGHQKTVFESHLIRVRLNSNVSDPRYFFYLFNSSVGRELMAGIISQGAGASGIKGSDLIELEVPRPPLLIQRQIADFLDSLEIQIEVLKQQNTVLESIAKALFKSWFVNFDPVHAKAAGQEPEGLSAEFAALFPSEFEESELGAIPKGWGIQSLDKNIDYLNGLALQKFPALGIETDLPVLKIAQLRAGKTDPSIMANVSSKPAYIIRDGDVVFSWSGTLEVKLWTGGDCALNQHLFKVSSSTLPKWFCYLATLSHLDNFRAIAESKQTTMGHIQRGHLTDAKIILPPTESLNTFSSVMSPIIDTVVNNSVLARTLGSIQDELLPRLISGKIRIEEAEEALADAMPSTEKQVA